MALVIVRLGEGPWDAPDPEWLTEPPYRFMQLFWSINWYFEGDHPWMTGPWEATEISIERSTERRLDVLLQELEDLFTSCPDPLRRRMEFTRDWDWMLTETEEFDAFLEAIRRRVIEAQAGIHTHPLRDPERPSRQDRWARWLAFESSAQWAEVRSGPGVHHSWRWTAFTQWPEPGPDEEQEGEPEPP